MRRRARRRASSAAAAYFFAAMLRLNQVAGHRRIVRRQLARFLERRDRLVVLPELLIREAEMRQQHAERERRRPALARNSATRGRERVDDGLILPPLLERLGEREEAPRVLAVLRDEPARRRFGRVEVAEPPLRLRQQIQRALVGRRASRRASRSTSRALATFSRPPAFSSAEA